MAGIPVWYAAAKEHPMAYVTPSSAAEAYDVIVVGSGAAGGQAAYTLTMDGARVLMLEAGRNYDPGSETPMFQTPDTAPLRGVATPDKYFGFFDATAGGGWTVPGEPYTNAAAEEGRQFKWYRARMLGGRTNHWGRIALRNGPYDFKPRSRDGLGLDWPISYEDVAPYYDKVEMLVGVYGTNDGLENTPDSPEGCLLPPPKARIGELLARQRGRTLGIPVIPVRRAVLTRPLDHKTLPARLHPGNAKAQRILAEDMQSRAACFWATSCGRGCSIRANYQSTTVHLPPALASGNLDLVVNGMAREVTVGPSGDRGHLHRHGDRPGAPREGEGGGPRGKRVRDRAPHAQFQEQPVPERPRQLERPARQIHHGHGRGQLGRPDPAP